MADTQGIVVEDIVRQMAVGLKVYDVNGTRLGTVQDYNTGTGWMLVDTGIVIEHDLFLGARDVNEGGLASHRDGFRYRTDA